MRNRVWLGLFLPLVIIAPTPAADSFPYDAEITTDDATVRCGPGEQFYSTSFLAPGDRIEVHRRDAQGWLAIRPPEGSFGWIDGRHLRMTSDPEIGRVTGKEAVAWIGSELGPVEDHRWQVQLDEGEAVRLLGKGEAAMVHGEAVREHFQIAPPAGEFRWIHERHITAHIEESPQPADIVAKGGRSEIELTDFRVALPESSSDNGGPQGDGFVPRRVGSNPTTEPRVASLAPRSAGPVGTLSATEVESRLEQLDIDLTSIVAQSPTTWKLEDLHRDATLLVDQSGSSAARSRARTLLSRITEFQRLQKRYAGLGLPEDEAARDVIADTSDPAAASSRSDFDPRFDGRGWLVPAYSSQRIAPPYALLDAEGRVVTFISPAPGLNLNRYLRKEIGIFGQRTPGDYLDKPHLTASRVVDLERHRR